MYTHAVLSLTVFPLLVAEWLAAVFTLLGVSALLVQGSAAVATTFVAATLGHRWGPCLSGCRRRLILLSER